MAAFSRLVRFSNPAGQIFYGEVPGVDFVTQESLQGRKVAVYKGETPFEDDFALTGHQEEIAEVLAPLPYVPIFECVGVNYLKHVQEAGGEPPKYPVIFKKPAGQSTSEFLSWSKKGRTIIRLSHKPNHADAMFTAADALAGPFEDIPIHPECQSQMDYEAELCVVIGKDCKNVTAEEALNYVLGYTAGNDVSARYWQWRERSGGQHGSAKGFDKFAPIGPVIVSPNAIGDPHDLWLKTIVNGTEVRQQSRTDDLIFKLPEIIKHLSRGTTLRKGTVIMSGTPSGVAAFMKPPGFLQDGDVVTVEIEKIGRIENKLVFEKASL
ncbi:uncharacterized protein Z519_02857 [Cladophialophora bantiana CBS 173.52]|uniref:Fumarylacetoacetase-like C-terminal domain-containing protein n=1 Tax=Cladophialophora bantiana (strain ATCC 10958 / CBS 173.52 / CDC B-1940 / NIH 8579) TaxID=1442370 RepID=A0A0D2HQR7_CLAB1|nr:uncharacterized protein Z519_02857 [Cladophialophora bantiana CBS 173.52]KIW95793.1 hypothetical protein Z519_02857 [Cladophialophora bantiana CBS 173.52]